MDGGYEVSIGVQEKVSLSLSRCSRRLVNPSAPAANEPLDTDAELLRTQRPYLAYSLHLVIVAWVVLISYWFWNVFLRKGQVFWLNEIPTGGRISAPSNLQKHITNIPLVKLFSCVVFVAAVETYDRWKECNPALSVFVMLGSVHSELVIHSVFLRASSAWCIMENELTPRQLQRFGLLTLLLFVSSTGYHFGVPFLFTTLVMIYCTLLTLEFHSIILNVRKLREGLVDQIARERGRRESNDVASALIEQMKVQLKLLVSFQQMMGTYLTAQIMINGPLYLVGRQVAVCIARQVLDLGIFVYFLCNFSECHVNAFPYVALPRAQTDSGTLMGREMLEQPEVWTYYSRDVSRDIEQLTNGDLHLGIPLKDDQEDGEDNGETAALSLVFNPSAVQYKAGGDEGWGSDNNV